MSNVKQGLAALRQHQQEQKERQEAANRPKAEWFKWPDKVEVATARFLQELDPDATNYDESRGVGFIAVEHQAPGPDGYKRRGLCTLDSDGECYPCERHKQDYKEGWRQRTNLYINVLVDFGDGKDKKVVILTRNANSAFTDSLIQEAVDEGSITDANYRITKTGSGTTTNWLLKRLKDTPFDDSTVEVYDLSETAIRAIPYEKQADYYGAVYSGARSEDEPAESAQSHVDADW